MIGHRVYWTGWHWEWRFPFIHIADFSGVVVWHEIPVLEVKLDVPINGRGYATVLDEIVSMEPMYG